MPSTIPFWISFVTTVLLLVASLVTGWTRKRRSHLWLGPLTILSMVVTVWLTERLMRRYDFPPDDLAFHLYFAYAGGILALPVVLTGVWLWKQPKARRWHQLAVYVWLVAVLTATGTGLWMFGLGTLKAG